MLHMTIPSSQQFATVYTALAGAEQRYAARPTAQMRKGLHLAIDSSIGSDDNISDIIVTDTTYEGLSAAGIGALTAGSRAMVEAP